MIRIKRAHTALLRDEVYALRYRAYRKEEAILADPSEMFEDRYDHQPNQILWALTLEEKVVGSIRTTWFDPASPHTIPEQAAYSDDIAKVAPKHARLLSGNRLVTDPDLGSMSSQLVLMLLRYHMVVADQKADWAVAAVRRNHVPFYQRVIRVRRASEGRLYPGLLCPMFLMACDFNENIGPVLERTPLLKPRGYERIFLDPAYQDVWEVGLPVET